jgi:hypothetical protein
MFAEVRPPSSKRHLALAGVFAGLMAAMPIVFADPVSPVTLTNVDSPDPVASGAELTYTITAVNIGGADTIDPGVTPLKWKLGIPEAPNSNICQ